MVAHHAVALLAHLGVGHGVLGQAHGLAPGQRRPCGWAPRRRCGRTAGRRRCTRARCPARRPTPPQWTFGCGRFRRSGRAGRGTDSAAAHSSSAGAAARGRATARRIRRRPTGRPAAAEAPRRCPRPDCAPVRLQMIVRPAASKASASRLLVEVFPLVPTVMTEPCAHLPRSSSSSDGSIASAIFPGRLAAGRLRHMAQPPGRNGAGRLRKRKPQAHDTHLVALKGRRPRSRSPLRRLDCATTPFEFQAHAPRFFDGDQYSVGAPSPAPPHGLSRLTERRHRLADSHIWHPPRVQPHPKEQRRLLEPARIPAFRYRHCAHLGNSPMRLLAQRRPVRYTKQPLRKKHFCQRGSAGRATHS